MLLLIDDTTPYHLRHTKHKQTKANEWMKRKSKNSSRFVLCFGSEEKNSSPSVPDVKEPSKKYNEIH